ncbi:DeoR/GlpR family DNA-binding transcription regulator (plasmid) [Streptomyces sp. NBC_01340]|uniref:DeoR/GlpR family DNA-binding transcription regulator n=1 Tax=unclassified Streptomyces TaxID=2593676 RepID=UPI00224CA7F9|nr:MULTISPECIES: DeoR/GlpR family DNA-binding transcription regulator [unclassified Streptomyces]MCX4460172.1 DeoR/GlpR family DNA-binding transcription regulator [Streptomyces sp. NBC_01719]MCX4500497.1 DeoR/GlpR family DNA-binding transcription regulator [Streptomyces sp. NBC_01728]MCX4598203.1 DeoR/GlpR family DNA-binding transcription regulator [Streptomyces sp. NBC_01549]WSI45528.1 DeoR/GlpR family DNA-binding transcription regulator [Streptomyces sp. NBC_01340]
MAAPQVRWSALLEMLTRDGRIEVESAAAELGVSAATIRRDLDELARQQMVTRTHGGAVINAIAYDLPLRYKAARNAPEKERIAHAAAGLVKAGAVVGLNGGTTTTEVARALATRADLSSGGAETAVTVVTNALNIANELVVRRHVKLVVTGGVARPASYELIGPLATELLAEIALDQVFIGVDAIDVAHGATAHHEGEASINRALARRAQQVVAVADSSKLDRRAFARICPLEDIDVLVTDKAASDELTESFAAAGVEVIRA